MKISNQKLINNGPFSCHDNALQSLSSRETFHYLNEVIAGEIPLTVVTYDHKINHLDTLAITRMNILLIVFHSCSKGSCTTVMAHTQLILLTRQIVSTKGNPIDG